MNGHDAHDELAGTMQETAELRKMLCGGIEKLSLQVSMLCQYLNCLRSGLKLESMPHGTDGPAELSLCIRV